MMYKTTPIQPFGILLEPETSLVAVNDLPIDILRDWVVEKHLLVLRGFDSFQCANSFSAYCERWGDISMWPFGKVLELVEQENPDDHIFDNSYVPLHWDGMYRPQVPELQIFHCVNAPLPGQGGRTTFSNTVLAFNHASAELKTRWQHVTGTYERKMAFYSSRTVSPIVNKHPYRNYSVIRYNEPPAADQGHFVNPPELEFTGVGADELADFHRCLKQALYDPRHFYAHTWQTGDMVIADNFSLLHGREAFTSRSPRHIRRVHVLSDPPFDNPGLVSYA